MVYQCEREKEEEIIRGKSEPNGQKKREREREKKTCQQLTDHVVAHELFALQLHPRTINDEPIVARTLTSIVEDNVYVCVCACAGVCRGAVGRGNDARESGSRGRGESARWKCTLRMAKRGEGDRKGKANLKRKKEDECVCV